VRVLAALVLVLVAGGCTRGPDAELLARDVNARLARALPPGVVTLAALERRGSQADTKAPPGETRRIVYFDADLRLEREFDFGTWDSPGVAGLVSALGAGPKGITGVTAGGNEAGDIIHAHGTLLYRRAGDGWESAASAGFAPSVAPAVATSAPPDALASALESIRRVIDSVVRDASPAQIRVIEEELTVAHAAIRARLAHTAEGYAIAAGPEHGQYLRFVRALTRVAGVRVVPLVTPGGEENLRLLRDGKVSLALSQGDAALDAFEGRGRFSAAGAHDGLRAIGSLYPEPVHVLVRADSTLRSPGELAGRRVAIGEPGSASRATALRVLEAHGVRLAQIRPLELPLGPALARLRAGTLDAVIQIIGMPADSVREAMAAVPLRLVPLDPRAVRALVAAERGYFGLTIPRATYADQDQAVPTVATAALLLVSADLSETEVAALARAVYEKGRDFTALGSAQGAQISSATASAGLPVPQHLGAVRALAAVR